jgi:hypothetical protein
MKEIFNQVLGFMQRKDIYFFINILRIFNRERKKKSSLTIFNIYDIELLKTME